jgi:hypothetical protein
MFYRQGVKFYGKSALQKVSASRFCRQRALICSRFRIRPSFSAGVGTEENKAIFSINVTCYTIINFLLMTGVNFTEAL